MYWTRLKVFLVLMAFALLLLGVRLAQLQIFAGQDYRAEAEANLIQPSLLTETRRGSILDRNGYLLATDAPRFDLCLYYPFLALEDKAFVNRLAARPPAPGRPVTSLVQLRSEMQPLWLNNQTARLRMAADLKMEPDELSQMMSDFWPQLARACGLDLHALDDQREKILRMVAARRQRVQRTQGEVTIREESAGRRGIAHPILIDLDDRTKGAVAILQSRYPFLIIKEHAKRLYAYGDSAAHVVGYVGEANEDDMDRNPDDTAAEPDERRAFRLGDLRGRAGIESSMENALRGTRGIEQYDRLGHVLRHEEPVPGQDVVLTLDVPFQAEVEAALASPTNVPAGYAPVRGAAVVIDLRDGGILAMASSPRFNPATIFDADVYAKLIAEGSGHPLLHRAVAGQLPPGSIFKLVTASAGLHEGKIAPTTTFTCVGALYPNRALKFGCWRTHGHGELALHSAIAESCDVYFYNVGLRLGTPALVAWGQRFGFGSKIGIELPGEAAGVISEDNHPCNLAIGQGKFTVTPLQAARMCALVATGGRLRQEVHIVKSPRPTPLAAVDLGLNQSWLATVRSGMVGVVNEPGATGYETVHSTLLTIAGKSGSAEANRELTHSWFVGYAPAENPQIAVAVDFEHAGGGSKVAGPVVKKIIETALRQGIIHK